MSDLPNRLRVAAREPYFDKPGLLVEAADTLEKLAAEINGCPFHAEVSP